VSKYDYEEIFQQAVRIEDSEERFEFLETIFRDDPDRVRETAEMTIWVVAHKLGPDRKEMN
jgi:hypothetical protein